MRAILAYCLAASCLVARADEEPGGYAYTTRANSQPSLSKALGMDVTRAAWVGAKDIVPYDLPGMTFHVGPDRPGPEPDLLERKQLVFHFGDGSITIDVFRTDKVEPEPEMKGGATPFMAEAPYEYGPAEFHGGKAAAATLKGQAMFAFVRDGYLFKVEAHSRREPGKAAGMARDAAETVWQARQKK